MPLAYRFVLLECQDMQLGIVWTYTNVYIIIVAIKSHLLFYFVIIMTILPDSWDQKESIVSTTPKSVTYHMYA